MNILKWLPYLKRWHFDPVTSIFTILIIPLFIYFLRVLAAFLKKLARYALEGSLYAANRFLWHSLAASLSLRRYCRLQLETDSRFLHVPSTRDIKLDLETVFIPLTMEYQGSSRKDYSHQNMLEISNRLRVIGDPGSGKSSLTKKLFRDACKLGMEHPNDARFPIRIELKTLQPPSGLKPSLAQKWLYDHLLSHVKGSAVYRVDECFEAMAQTQGLLVLLDGLDEVAVGDYARVHAVIDGLGKLLAKKGDKNVIVLTMRTQFHQQVKDNYRESFGPALFIKPFTPTDIYEFLSRWPFSSSQAVNIARIYKQLTDRPTLREMCTNPLILAMYVAEDQNTRDVLAPESRTQFYSRVTEELILTRRLKQTGLRPAPVKLKEQRERILGRLSFDHLLDPSEPSNSLSWKKGVATSASILGCSEEEAELALNELSNDTGLFTEERPKESFRFIHLTICEFLAAYEAIQGEKDGWKQLLTKHRMFLADRQPQMKSRLMEVIPFACGLLPRVHRDQALSDVAGLNDLRLLARCFFETKLYEHSVWPSFTEKMQREILHTPEHKWDERWLADLHLLNLVLKDAELSSVHTKKHSHSTDLSRFYQTLISNQRESLYKLLSACATQDAAVTFRIAELCGLDLPRAFPSIIIRYADQPPFLALLLEQFRREGHRIEMWAKLFSEAGLRSRVVAKIINGHPAASDLAIRTKTVARRYRWNRGSELKESLYTQLITIALDSDEPSNFEFFLPALRDVAGPGSRPWLNHLERWASRITLALFMVSLGVLRPAMRHMRLTSDLWTSVLTFSVAIPLYVLALYLQFTSLVRQNTYKLALNLRTSIYSTMDFSRSPLLLPLEIVTSLMQLKKVPREMRKGMVELIARRQSPSFYSEEEARTTGA